MQLRSPDGRELELSIVGYQYPEAETDPWDSNALLVAVRVVAPEGTWEVTDPCLTTWEAAHLVRWLTVAAHAPPGVVPFPLNQPNVTFSARGTSAGDRVRLRVSFELERRPPWSGATGVGTLRVDLDIDRAQLADAARSLAAQLTDYPRRGDDPTL